MTDSGFVAGTLVHTDQGLVPIEQIRVGDLVLSMPEEGVGEKAYKSVLKTFKSAEKMPIMGPFPTVYCTANYLFWVDGEGWVAGEDLDRYSGGPVYTLKNGLAYPSYSPGNVNDPFDVGGLYVIQTAERGLAIHVHELTDKNTSISDMAFDLIDFRSGTPLAVYSDDDYSNLGYYSRDAINNMKQQGLLEIPYTIILNGETDKETILHYDQLIDSILTHGGHDTGSYKDYVYNIKVEGYHTYFIDEIGFRVQSPL